MMEKVDSINIELLKELKEIMGDDFDILVNTFLSDSAQRIESIQVAIAQKDAKQLREAAHSFKGSALNLAADRLTLICKDLEDMGKKNVFNDAENKLTMLTKEFEAVKLILLNS